MPVFNRESVVGRAVRSVVAQSYREWELLVVDDGSSDGTRAAVRQAAGDDPRVRILRTDHRGVSAARNQALAESGGLLVAYLDSDNRWHPDFLRYMVPRFASGSHDCGYAGMNMIDEVRGTFRPWIPAYERAQLEQMNFIDLNAFVHRRTLVDRHGTFDESLSRCVDWDLTLRYTRESAPFQLRAVLVDYFASDPDRISGTEPFAENYEKISRRHDLDANKGAEAKDAEVVLECPVCGYVAAEFRTAGVTVKRPNAVCPLCGAFERHRLIGWHLAALHLIRPGMRVLEVGPTPCLQRMFAVEDANMRSIDLAEHPGAVVMDVEEMSFASETFDAIVCIHVLEHVVDDRKALRELFRVLRPGGWAVLMVPIDERKAVTDEDPTLTDPEERVRRFGQKDHVRAYGFDFGSRCTEAGFRIEVVAVQEPGILRRHAFLPGEKLYLGWKDA